MTLGHKIVALALSAAVTAAAGCRLDGAQLRSVARPEQTARVSSLWNERLLDAIDAQTAVVNISSVHWTDGVRFDLEAIGSRAREVGALTKLNDISIESTDELRRMSKTPAQSFASNKSYLGLT